jgi:uncharacterized protein YdhG (YjbR/CyaY superfamily)
MTNPHDDYLAKQPESFRSALQSLRETIRSAVPKDAEEGLSYGVPAFRVGRPIVAYAAFKKHCGLYPLSPDVIEAFAKDLEDFETAKGTIRFTPDKPLPKGLVKKIVKARLAELDSGATTKTVKKAKKKTVKKAKKKTVKKAKKKTAKKAKT